MSISAFLGDIASGIGDFLPGLATALYETFISLFFVAGEGTNMELNVLGQTCIAFFIIGLGMRVMPTVLGWLKAKMGSRKGKRRKK